jgi:CHAD domain-containing protein
VEPRGDRASASDPAHAGPRDFALLDGEPAADGIRRIADGRAADALERLRSAEGTGAGEGIHEARKSLKKLRSVLRLTRPRLGKGLYRLESARFRDAGRVLSGHRDADALIETVDGLEERFADELGPTALRPLRRALEAERDERRNTAGRPREVDRAIAIIEAGRAGIASWPLKGNGFGLVRGGLRRAYARGRGAMAEVAREPRDEAVHDWRKRVKDLWYMCAILERSFPALVGATAEQAHELSSLLGDHHDLAVLAGRLRDDPGLLGGGMPMPTAIDLIERRQAELIDDAMPLGRRLYAEKPKRFSARLEAYWKA